MTGKVPTILMNKQMGHDWKYLKEQPVKSTPYATDRRIRYLFKCNNCGLICFCNSKAKIEFYGIPYNYTWNNFRRKLVFGNITTIEYNYDEFIILYVNGFAECISNEEFDNINDIRDILM